MVISVTGFPLSSVMTVFAGRRNSSPGSRGDVITVSAEVGDAIFTACAVSSGVIQMV